MPEPMSAEETREREILSKITWRIIPVLFIAYLIAYVDRINVGFAKLQLRETFGVDEGTFSSIYGLGAGLFFIGYFIFEVPSNLILQRVGARMWIARIMLVWGVISAAMMFMGSAPIFYLMRFLLGVAEAGFFPGIILYLTFWYPAKERARIVALFATGGVIAGIIGSPVSGAILNVLNGSLGLEGWQWLFLLEGIPAVLLGIAVWFLLPDRPAKVRWLSEDEKAWLQGRLDEDLARSGAGQKHRLIDAFASGRVWLLCLLYFLLNVGGYGFEMWLPSIIKKNFPGQGEFVVGLINAIPYLVAAIAMVLWGRHSDRTGERRWHVAAAAIASAAGFGLSAYFKNPIFAMAALVLAFVGIKCMLGPFWALGTGFLSGTAAAGGIAFINSTGNLGGFVGPYTVGLIKDDAGERLFLGGALLLMGLLALAIRRSGDIAAEGCEDGAKPKLKEGVPT
jgi:ACS family tartrate transporter-like MFS transporter